MPAPSSQVKNGYTPAVTGVGVVGAGLPPTAPIAAALPRRDPENRKLPAYPPGIRANERSQKPSAYAPDNGSISPKGAAPPPPQPVHVYRGTSMPASRAS